MRLMQIATESWIFFSYYEQMAFFPSKLIEIVGVASFLTDSVINKWQRLHPTVII